MRALGVQAEVAQALDGRSERISRALAELEQAQALEARWQASADADADELRVLERRMGEDVLSAPEDQREVVTAALTAQVARLRAAVDVDTRTAAVAAERIPAARQAVLAAEADNLREELASAEQALSKHMAATQKLLDQLREHDNAEYVLRTFDEAPGAYQVRPTRRTAVLTLSVGELTVRVALLEVAIAGLPLPRFVRQMPIPTGLFSPLLADLPRGQDAGDYLDMLTPDVVSQDVASRVYHYVLEVT